MKRFALLSALAFGASAVGPAGVFAKDPVALTLLDRPSARAAGLGEAMTAIGDDVAAFHYNPAALGTLGAGQASFLYENGPTNDQSGRLLAAVPVGGGVLGTELGYYDGGHALMSEDGVSASNLNVETDRVVSLGYGRRAGSWEWGLAAKYVSMDLLQAYSDGTPAADAGVAVSVLPGLRLGASLQNLGGTLKFVEARHPLPQTARVGAAWTVAPKWGASLLGDCAFDLVEGRSEPAVALEVAPAPIALRVGYQDGDLKRLAFGAGFILGRMRIDYSFSLLQDLNAAHLISVTFAAPEARPRETIFSSVP